jgi:hypothetical protein
VSARGLEDVERAEHVDGGVVDRLLNRVAHADLGSVMAHHLRPLGREHIIELAVADVHLVEARARRHVSGRARAQIVQDRHVVALQEAGLRHV